MRGRYPAARASGNAPCEIARRAGRVLRSARVRAGPRRSARSWRRLRSTAREP